MKKYLSFILSFLLMITTITVTPVHADGELRREVLYMGVKYDVAAGSEKEQYEFPLIRLEKLWRIQYKNYSLDRNWNLKENLTNHIILRCQIVSHM
ncbi:hypothetical protein [Eubacterium sp.]|uniref:hypothetical protein n=2 Tax=Eubacterium TaxID=1730 RepID=UPI0039930E3C